MKRTLVLLTLLAVGGLSAPTYADSPFSSTYFKGWGCNYFNLGCGSAHAKWHKHVEKFKHKHGHKHEPKHEAPSAPAPKPSVASAPEIDGAQAGLALALLGALVAMTREKYRLRTR